MANRMLSVVIATKIQNTGDGIAVASRVGLRPGISLDAFECSEAILPGGRSNNVAAIGARFVNAMGEKLYERYSKTLGINTDPHYNTIGMAMEMRAGRGPIYMDTSGLKPESSPL